MSLQVFRDGRPDRDANKVSNQLLAKRQKEDDHAQILDQFLKSPEAGDGTYQHMGSVGADLSRSLVAPKAMMGEISKSDRVNRVRARMAANEPVISLYYDELHNVDLLALEDSEAYEEGWICPECLQYQNIVMNECNWRFTGEAPADPKYRGCGFRRDII